jgi:hypothetical protein
MKTRFATAFLAASCLVPPAFGATHTVLASYGPVTDATPSGGLVPDGSGGFLGVARGAPSLPHGSVVHFSPPASAGEPWTAALLYAFAGGADGSAPEGALLADGAGGFYGTTTQGGSANAGTFYHLSPPEAAARAGTPGAVGWTHSVLYNFQGGSADASGPHDTLVMGNGGVLYGSAGNGGPGHMGAVFQLTPPAVGGGSWSESIAAFFAGKTNDGAKPMGVVADPSGVLYVAAIDGGPTDKGEIVQLTPPESGSGPWTKTVLYAFATAQGSTDGRHPIDLVEDSAGNLYGTTPGGGTGSAGTYYTLQNSGGSWTETVLYNFAGGAGDGATPGGVFVRQTDGSVFGATKAGGNAGFGVIYELLPGAGSYTDSVEYSFQGRKDGAEATKGLLAGGNGSYYGVTLHGGTGNKGTLYQFTP